MAGVGLVRHDCFNGFLKKLHKILTGNHMRKVQRAMMSRKNIYMLDVGCHTDPFLSTCTVAFSLSPLLICRLLDLVTLPFHRAMLNISLWFSHFNYVTEHKVSAFEILLQELWSIQSSPDSDVFCWCRLISVFLPLTRSNQILSPDSERYSDVTIDHDVKWSALVMFCVKGLQGWRPSNHQMTAINTKSVFSCFLWWYDHISSESTHKSPALMDSVVRQDMDRIKDQD